MILLKVRQCVNGGALAQTPGCLWLVRPKDSQSEAELVARGEEGDGAEERKCEAAPQVRMLSPFSAHV